MEQPFYESEFDWDEFNIRKNWIKHRVKFIECEEVFFDRDVVILPDPTHSDAEERFVALGRTKAGRLLFTVFTQRGGKIRVVSSREMSKKERRKYHEEI